MTILALKQAFLDDWAAATQPHALRPTARVCGHAEIDIFPTAHMLDSRLHNEQVCLGNLVVPRDHRRKGEASRAMNALTQMADTHGIGICLQAIPPCNDTGPRDQTLIKFYQKHGFVRRNGYYNEMYRAPAR